MFSDEFWNELDKEEFKVLKQIEILRDKQLLYQQPYSFAKPLKTQCFNYSLQEITDHLEKIANLKREIADNERLVKKIKSRNDF